MNSPSGWISEIFVSLQGEGSWLGRRQIFVRLAGCSQHCAYCDTRPARAFRPEAWLLKERTKTVKAGHHANPVEAGSLADLIAALDRAKGPFHSVAFTGGEPLEQAEFLAEAARRLRSKRPGLKVMLETNGLEDVALSRVIREIDFIAADFKLEMASGMKNCRVRHARFLAVAAKKDGCLKMVVTPATTPAEIRAAVRLARLKVPRWDFILQPAAGFAWRQGRAAEVLEQLLRAASALHPEVRVIPQIHRLMGID